MTTSTCALKKVNYMLSNLDPNWIWDPSGDWAGLMLKLKIYFLDIFSETKSKVGVSYWTYQIQVTHLISIIRWTKSIYSPKKILSNWWWRVRWFWLWTASIEFYAMEMEFEALYLDLNDEVDEEGFWYGLKVIWDQIHRGGRNQF